MQPVLCDGIEIETPSPMSHMRNSGEFAFVGMPNMKEEPSTSIQRGRARHSLLVMCRRGFPLHASFAQTHAHSLRVRLGPENIALR